MAALAMASVAQAYVYNAIVDFNLTETAKSYPSNSNPSCWTSTQQPWQYRWSDDPDHTTVISSNFCGDLAMIGKKEIAPHDTSYHTIGAFNPGQGGTIVLRGRVAIGAGSMYHHDGVWAH